MKFSKISRFICKFKALNFGLKVERLENSNLVKEPGHKAAMNHKIYQNPVKT